MDAFPSSDSCGSPRLFFLTLCVRSSVVAARKKCTSRNFKVPTAPLLTNDILIYTRLPWVVVLPLSMGNFSNRRILRDGPEPLCSGKLFLCTSAALPACIIRGRRERKNFSLLYQGYVLDVFFVFPAPSTRTSWYVSMLPVDDVG